MDQSQVPIPNPPEAITTKDLLYIKDVLSWELLAFKKFHFNAGQVNSPDIKEALEKAGRMHQEHFQKLISHLQINNDSVMKNLPSQQQLQ